MKSNFFDAQRSAVTLVLCAGFLPSITPGRDVQPYSMIGTKIPTTIVVSAVVKQQGPAAYTAEALDKLVAPVALYPDPLLAQVLPASTYPVEVVQASKWMRQHRGMKAQELEASLARQQWAPSVRGLCPFPDVLEFMDTQVEWTTQLGDAVLNKEQHILDAIQRMRLMAHNAGTLQSNDKQIVEVERIGNRSIVSIRPHEPKLIYVPIYDPAVVYYPPKKGGSDWAFDQVGFGFGVEVPPSFWDWDCDWNHGLIVFDRDRYRLWHRPLDWEQHDWDRFDWQSATLKQRDGQMDIAHIEIDNIDINRRDWRHTDLRRFDWNRIDWRPIEFERLGLGKTNWKDIDWEGAGIKNPQLVQALRDFPTAERDALRERLEKAHANQQYKDRLARLQRERLLGEKAPEVHAMRWAHNPDHRRGVAYSGEAREMFAEGVPPPGRREGAAEPKDQKQAGTIVRSTDGVADTTAARTGAQAKRRTTASSEPNVRRTMRWAEFPPRYPVPEVRIIRDPYDRRYAIQDFGASRGPTIDRRATEGGYRR